MKPEHMPELAHLIARGLNANDVESVGRDVRKFRSKFQNLHFIRQ